MPPMPVISGAQLVRALEVYGYEVVRQRGSHVRMRLEGRPSVTVPLHRTLKRGTLGGILDDVGISVAQLLELL